MNKAFIKDYEKKIGKKYIPVLGWIRILYYHDLHYIYLLRKAKQSKIRNYYNYRLRRLGKKYGIEIDSKTIIGEQLRLSHAYGITVNDKAIIGNNVLIFKGATVGSVRSGKREGVPIIGDNVVLGINSFVCGGIKVGNNVLIAANSFVDFDVPDNSLVIGNPGKIIRKENPTKDYN